MRTLSICRRQYRYLILTVCPLLLFILLLPFRAMAQEERKAVRVGWYESSFNTTDENGRKTGYAYEYQQKIASYTGWQYEYVSGGWSALMEMLQKGEIDLLSDVSYTPERDGTILYPSLPMGTEEYYLFVAHDNTQIVPESPASMDGKKAGVNKGSLQEELFLEWIRQNGISVEIVELTCPEAESLQRLESGEFDAYVTVDSFAHPERAVPVFKIGSSDFYFALNKDRTDLLGELNHALSRIQDENRYYNEHLFEKYIRRTGANAFFTPDELDWLSSHGPIRVGYQDNYLAFCAKDEETGELTGALKDYLTYASESMVNAHIEFETTAYPSAADALDALAAGDLDCVFPSNLDSYDGETMGVVMTPSIIRTDMYAVVRETDQDVFSNKEHVLVAVNEGNPNYETVLTEHFPEWTIVRFPDTKECLRAVADRVADCLLISNYRYNNISRMCNKLHLTTISTGVDLEYSFAVSDGQPQLYSILSKATSHVPDTSLNAAVSYYISEDARLTFVDFIMDNLGAVMGVTAGIVLLILALMMRSMFAERKARKLILATETDDLTGLYNRKYFFQYANRMYHDHPDIPMDAIVVNIEQFHSVNALNGREFGDQVLCTLGSGIRAVSNEIGGIAGRFEADRFDLYCRHTERYQEIFSRLQAALRDLTPSANLRLRMGVMPWQEGLEPVQQFDRARTACNMARGHYKQHLIIYDTAIGEREIYEQRLLNDLHRALDAYEFDVYYQPKFNIQSEPPALVSTEALIRWNHSQLGMIPPEDFIPLLERNGMIADVDKYVWSEAARQVAKWRARYNVTIPVSVNLSRVDVFDPALEQTLDELLRYNGLEHQDLKLEVTESAYTENAEQVIQVVSSLRQKGYQVEMDDFGTGYSSLSMLSAMPVDVLKMDRGFIRNIEHDEKDIRLVELILGIARDLDIPVIAEGVETKKQVQLLKGLGCALVQGYYFSHPLHPSEFETTFLQTR